MEWQQLIKIENLFYKLNGAVKRLNEIELKPTDKSKPFFYILLYASVSAITYTKLIEKIRQPLFL